VSGTGGGGGAGPAGPRRTLRVMTYNIRACLGTDGVRSPERIAEVIAAARPDAVALQEVDLERERSGRTNQAARIAELAGLRWIAAASLTDASGGYGNAVLTRAPAELADHRPLPHLPGAEPRSAMVVRLAPSPDANPDCDPDALPSWSGLHLLNTHLGFRRADRRLQMRALLADRWLAGGAGGESGPAVLLCGDLNCTPRDRWFARLTERLLDAPAAIHRRPAATWPTRRPLRRIDHVLVPPTLTVTDARVLRTPTSRAASDHYPLVVDLAWGGCESPGAGQ